jgi:hypothetical protein
MEKAGVFLSEKLVQNELSVGAISVPSMCCTCQSVLGNINYLP